MPPENERDESLAVKILRQELAELENERAQIDAQIKSRRNALQQLVAGAVSPASSKNRIISVVKRYVFQHGPTSYSDLLKQVIEGGEIVISGDPETRLKQSLGRCISAGTMQEKDGLYDLTESEKKRIGETK